MTISLETSDLPSNSTTDAQIKAGDTFYGRISPSGDRDWIAVDLVAGQTYSFAAVGVGTAPLHDAYLRLLGPTVNRTEAENDDGLPNLNAIIIDRPTQTGRYYLEVSGTRALTGDYGVTMAKGSRPDFDVPLIAGVILESDSTWSSPTLTYGFRVNGNDGNTLFRSSFSASQQNSIALIMAYYAEVTNLNFSNQGNTNTATLLFANYRTNNGIAAYAYGPGPSSVSGDVWYNSFYNNSDFGLGSSFYETMLHEIGHAMGLSHPGLYDANSGKSITYANSAQFTQDSESLTLMSYFDSRETGGSDLTAQTLAIADILALQNAYGANMSTRAGDTTYGYGGSGIYDFASNITPKLTIWDGGGNDTLDLSAASTAQRINLNAGSLSNILGYIGNLGIAIGTNIENARGGSGADTIFGNALDNDLFGGGGIDQLFGGAGADLLNGGTGADVLVGGTGDDVFVVDNINDRIIEGMGGGYDIVQTTVNFALAAGIAVQELRAEGTGSVNLAGNGSANRLVAGTGVNSLTGGGGRDVFVFDFASSSTAKARDIITDFNRGVDRIDLSEIDADTNLFANQAFSAVGTNPSANRLWWQSAGVDLILLGDVDGNATADFEVLIKNLTLLTTADIIL